jgi:4'-phosphopantetheinyl transferase
VDVAHRLAAFFNWWTRKEAFSKAIDLGLSLELSRFDVSLRPGDPARLLRTGYGEAETRQWSLHTIELDPGFAATLAVRSVQPRISCYLTRADEWLSRPHEAR